MIYRKYAEYKESGIAWLGEVPKHWEVSLLKWRYEVTLGKMLKSKQTAPDETEAPYLRAANIQWRGVDTTDVKRMWFTEAEKKKLKLYRDDLLVSEGGDVGRSSLWNEEIEGCYIQNSVNRIRARENGNTRFLYYWMYFIKHVGYIDMICNKATIAHFTVEKVGATPCVYPPLEEQKQIAAFLDKETTKIDTLIDKQEQLITLLREKRQAVISHAVTRGLNPNAEMKESGIEWIGEVPGHWEVRRLKYICRFAYGDSLPSEMRIEGDVPVYGSNGQVGFHSFSNMTAPCIVIGRKGSFGKVNYSSDVAFAIDTTFFVDSRYTTANIRWLYYLLGLLQLDAVSKDSIVPGLNREDAYQQMGLYPPLEEQKQIAAFLDKETAKIDALIEKCEAAIALLKERRTALISAAVTGKIDVRRAV